MAYAVFPRPKVRSTGDQDYTFIITNEASPVLVETLLRHGADPNGLDVDSVSIWRRELMSYAEKRDSTQSGDILKLLIAYGADPLAVIEGGGRTWSVLFVISHAYRDDPAMQTELITCGKPKMQRFSSAKEMSLRRLTTIGSRSLAAAG